MNGDDSGVDRQLDYCDSLLVERPLEYTLHAQENPEPRSVPHVTSSRILHREQHTFTVTAAQESSSSLVDVVRKVYSQAVNTPKVWETFRVFVGAQRLWVNPKLRLHVMAYTFLMGP
jgi:hypothetical protein